MVQYYDSIADSRRYNTAYSQSEESNMTNVLTVTTPRGPAVSSLLEEGGTESTTHAWTTTSDAGKAPVAASCLSVERKRAAVLKQCDRMSAPVPAKVPGLAEIAELMDAEVITEKDLSPLDPSRLSSDFMSRKVAEYGEEHDNFFIVNLGAVVDRYRLWCEHLPRVKAHYAVKCNPDTAVVSVLAQLGAGFDCASRSEIEQVFQLGGTPDRIIYANPCKLMSQIKFAASVDVRRTTFDNVSELQKLKTLHPNAQCILRIATDDSGAQCQLSSKYGAKMSDVAELLRECKLLGLDLHGVSFHVGSGCTDDGAFEEPIRNAAEVFRMAEEMGFSPTLLDIGGGFPGNDEVLPFSKIASSINKALDEFFPEGCGVDVVAEPGRFFAHVTSTLAVSVFAKRDLHASAVSQDQFISITGDVIVEDEFDIPDNSAYAQGEETGAKAAADGPFQYLYYVSDGLYGSFNCVMYDHYDLVRPHLVDMPDRAPVKERMQNKFLCKVFGPTCDGLDCILPSAKLPELMVGDWLYFEEMGAYSWAAASSFNGFTPPGRKYVVPASML